MDVEAEQGAGATPRGGPALARRSAVPTGPTDLQPTPPFCLSPAPAEAPTPSLFPSIQLQT